MDLGLRGRRALVTGASAGIGRHIVCSFAAEGASGLATFLGSARASYITGTVMHVDGGLRRYMF